MNIDLIQAARERYRPESVQLIFVAEAPPCTDGQFFYFEDVTKHDNLFLYIIRAVFPDLEPIPVKDLRTQKATLLNRFKEAGYFLEDSVFESIPKGTTNAQKEKLIKASQEDLDSRLSKYKDVPIVILSSLVFKCNYTFLSNKYTILNNSPIPFPGNGQQNKFKEEIGKIAL